MKVFLRFLLAFCTMSLFNCTTNQSILKVSELQGYQAGDAKRILFLHFKIIDQGKGKPEKVVLVSGKAGSGVFKNITKPVDSPYRIEVTPRFSTGYLELSYAFEHPLYRSVEVPSQDGSLSKSALNATEGDLFIRLQEEKYMQSVELYSIKPDQEKLKIYTLHLKQ